MSINIERRDFRDTLRAAETAGGVELLFTSPPYDDARTYGSDVSFSFKDYQDLGDHVFRAVKPGGHALVNLAGPVRDTPRGTERSLTPWKVLIDWIERVGFRSPDVLAYGRMGMPAAYTGRFRSDWEPLLWFVKPGGVPFFDKVSIAEATTPFDGTSARSRRQDGGMNLRRTSGWAAEEGRRHRGTLWWYGNVTRGTGDAQLEATGHPARFTLWFALDVIKCFCPRGGTVCDPFVGSGTTAVAATSLERSFIGGDLHHDPSGKPWADIAREMTASPVQDLFEDPNG